MRDATLVKLWSQVSRSFLPRAATARETETAQNAFLAGALLALHEVDVSGNRRGNVATIADLGDLARRGE